MAVHPPPALGGASEEWPPDARLLVERAIAAHGGADRWRSVKSIRLPFETARGRGASRGQTPLVEGHLS